MHAVRRPSAIFRSLEEHTWVSPRTDGTFLVGADEQFFREAGEVVYCDLPPEGEKLVKGRRCARTIDSTSLVHRPFYSPLSGTVIEVNDRMEHEPWETQRDPYGEGWLFRIAPSKLDEEVRSMTLEKGP